MYYLWLNNIKIITLFTYTLFLSKRVSLMFFRETMKMGIEGGLTLMTLGGMIRLVMRKIYLM